MRSYLDRPIPADIVAALQAEVEACNAEAGLHIQLITDEPRAFGSFTAHYGMFSGVKNYFALVGKRATDWMKRSAITASSWCFTRRCWV